MNFRQIEAFRAVMETHSVTEAADRLRISQPNVSRLVASLEHSVGFSLFERSPGRPLIATDDARALYSEVERSFIALGRIQQVATEILSFGKGRIRIAASTSLGHRLTPAAIQRFRARFPETALTLQMVSAGMVLSMIGSQQADIGLIGDAPELVGFDCEPLLVARGACVVPVGHRLSSRELITPADLEGESFVSYPVEDHVRRHIDNVFEDHKVNRVMLIETRFTETICALVGEGVGVSIVNPIIATRLATQPIKLIRFDVEIPFSCQLVFLNKHPRSRLAAFLAQSFREAVQDLFSTADYVKVIS